MNKRQWIIAIIALGVVGVIGAIYGNSTVIPFMWGMLFGVIEMGCINLAETKRDEAPDDADWR